MADALKIYDADQISIVMIGIPVTGGFDDGEFLTIEADSEDFTVKVGTDGQVTRSKTNNRVAKITIKLMQSSDANAAFSALNNLDRSNSNGAGVGPMLIRDRGGSTLYTASKCWIMQPPDVSFDREATAREWVFQCADFVRFDGSN